MLKKFLVSMIAMHCTLSFGDSYISCATNDTTNEVQLYYDYNDSDSIPANSQLCKFWQVPGFHIITINKNDNYLATFVDTGNVSERIISYYGIHDDKTPGYLHCYAMSIDTNYAKNRLMLRITDNGVTVEGDYSQPYYQFFKEVDKTLCN